MGTGTRDCYYNMISEPLAQSVTYLMYVPPSDEHAPVRNGRRWTACSRIEWSMSFSAHLGTHYYIWRVIQALLHYYELQGAGTGICFI